MRYLIAGVIATVLSISAATAEQRKLDIAATEFPPFYGAEMENQGFMTEIILEAFKRGGYEADVTFLPWKRALEGTKKGKHDGLFTVWHRPEREEWFLFSDPLPANELVFFKQKNNDIKFGSYADLKPFKIGVVRGYATPPGFDEAGLKTAEAKDDAENLRKLNKGRVDLVLADRIVAQHIINTEIPGAADSLDWLEPPAHVDIQYLVISKEAEDHQSILADFNKALGEMKSDGTLDGIMAKHGF